MLPAQQQQQQQQQQCPFVVRIVGPQAATNSVEIVPIAHQEGAFDVSYVAEVRGTYRLKVLLHSSSMVIHDSEVRVR
jgi:hypothetical protein